MTSLETLWLVSLAMAGVSLGIMVLLLIARLITAGLTRRRLAERDRLVPLLLGDDAGGPAPDFNRKLLTTLAVELIELVRGAERDRLVAAATAMGVPERLRHQLDSGSPRVRLAAAEALAQFADDKSIARLRAALQDRNSSVRIAAALSLAATGQTPPASELVYKLGIGSTENSLLAASLFRDVAERRPEELKALLVDPAIPAGAKAAIIESLSASADYTLVPLIVSLVGEEDNPRHLTRYLRALGAFGHPAAEPAIRRALENPHWEVRGAAARAAGRIGLTGLAPNLRRRLGDSEWWVRFRSAEALTLFGPAGEAILRDVAASDSEPGRTAATKILAERNLH
ncbi:HEAT repeat domain-containing protein [Sphingomonas sabuli]|uniref:HEAT repeat domain-containing protein n=1 Tax=Sphingomonas sabuli TaxID=2764186 RepID=A0A7G9L1J0_9SPHN|nr:HEAT repeat domain-containing protein [Sphingomonas sabuli]QNM82489.1 HEAT repeat domain-containing protein [Sphingomonas sabuli]